MLTATASAISESFCGVLNIHLVLGSTGLMINAEAASEIIGTSASTTTSRMPSELGVTVEPMMTSTLSSEISLRVFLTASVVSDLSSRTMKFTFWPAMVGEPSISKVFFSGIPSDAAGPVADRVTPTLISAAAMAQYDSAAAATYECNDFMQLLRG